MVSLRTIQAERVEVAVPHPSFSVPVLLSHVLAVLVSAANLAGIFFPRVYANEAPTWAAQGFGQDIANIFLVVPLLVICSVLAAKGSVRAYLVWLGLLAYLSYSYLMYAYCTTFGPMFPVYIASLAMSFYLLAGAVYTTDAARIQRTFAPQTPSRLTGWLLVAIAGLFFLLEGMQIAGALQQGVIPKSASDIGLRVDPVQVQDLGLFLPALFISGVLLLRRHPLGYLLAAPLLTHLVVLGVAVITMAGVMIMRGIPTGPQVFVAIGTSTLVSLAVLVRFLRSAGVSKGCCGNCDTCGS